MNLRHIILNEVLNAIFIVVSNHDSNLLPSEILDARSLIAQNSDVHDIIPTLLGSNYGHGKF